MSATRGTALIVAGSLVGQVGSVVCMPLLARIYGPQQLGHFSVFVATAGLLSTTAALHYELAIPLPRLARDARLLTVLGFAIVAAGATILSLLVAGSSGTVLALLGAQDLGTARFMLPLSLLLTGCCTLLTMQAVRRHAYALNAWSKALQGGVQCVGQAGVALLGLNWIGLVFAQLAASVVSMVPLLGLHRGFERSIRTPLACHRLLALAKRYRDLPLAAAPASFVNSAVANAPTLMLAGLFGADAAGWYGLGFRVLQVPARFLGQAVSQVFLGSAAQAAREQRLPMVVEPAYRALFVLAVHTFVPAAVLAPDLFEVVFGSQWLEAGRYTQYLSTWLLLGFVVTPLSMLVTVLHRQRQELRLQVLYLLLLAASLVLGAAAGSASVALGVLGLCGSVYLACKLWWLLGIAGCERRRLARFTARELLLAFALHGAVVAALHVAVSGFALCVAAAVWLSVVHLFNLRVRRSYELH